MSTWHATVGVQYTPHNVHHPASPRIHADGYLDITAESYEDARHLVHEALGTAWASLYEPDYDMSVYHPLGCVGTIDACSGCGQVCVLNDGVCDWCTDPDAELAVRISRAIFERDTHGEGVIPEDIYIQFGQIAVEVVRAAGRLS